MNRIVAPSDRPFLTQDHPLINNTEPVFSQSKPVDSTLLDNSPPQASAQNVKGRPCMTFWQNEGVVKW